jgi:carboxyl-terminal processing protease
MARTRSEFVLRLSFFVSAVALAFLSSCATAPTAYVEPAPLSPAARTALNLQVHDAVWQMVHDKYFDPHFRGVDWDAMRTKYRDQAAAAQDDAQLYAVLDHLCHELKESHLAPLPPLRTHEIRTEYRMAVGMGWTALDGRQVVTEIVPNGPAEEAGVQAGWIITTCEGQPMHDGPPLRPAPGRSVTYGFLDLKNEPRAITFQPQLLKFDQLVSRELPGGNRYLRFDRFGPDTLHWLSEQLKEHRHAPGVILDLRENPGGYVVAFQLAVGEFFDHRVTTGRFVRRNGRTKDARNLSLLPARYAGKVVILTSGATGSAAEIFTHVLQYHGRATVVGRRTAGAVIVSRTWPLPGGGTLQIPVQDYRGLDGRRLEGRGVLPDIGVPEPDLADLRTGRDPDVESALSALGQPERRPGTLTAASGSAAMAARVIGLP